MSLEGRSIVVTSRNRGIDKAVVLAAAVTGMNPELLRRLNGAIPLALIIRAAEIADVVVFLASDKAGHVNATTVTVDGGLSQSGVGL